MFQKDVLTSGKELTFVQVLHMATKESKEYFNMLAKFPFGDTLLQRPQAMLSIFFWKQETTPISIYIKCGRYIRMLFKDKLLCFAE